MNKRIKKMLDENDSFGSIQKLKLKLLGHLKDLEDVGKFLKEKSWSELDEATQYRARYRAGCIMSLVFLIGKYKIDLSGIRQEISPRLILALLPIYFYVS